MNYLETTKERLASCHKQMRQLEHLLAWGDISTEEFVTRRAVLTQEIKILEEVLAAPVERDSA